MKALQHTYTTVKERRNVKRIWLEGLKLEASGFKKGVMFRLDFDFDSGAIEAVIDPVNGTHTVSGKLNKTTGKVTPIIDICNADIVDVTKGANRVRVDFYEGSFRTTINHLDLKLQAREDSLIENVNNGVVTEGTLCVGIGMATAAQHQGFSEKGIKSSVEWIVDRNRDYLQVAVNNNRALNSDTTIIEASLEEVEPHLLSPVNVIQVSLGCTGHSKSGITKNKLENAESHKTDATAVFGLMRIVEQVNPAIITSENVREAQDSATYTLLRAMLETLGYIIHEVVLNQEQSGAFEVRPRYWFIAISKNLPQIDMMNVPHFARQYETMADVYNYDNNDEWRDHKYLKEKAIRDKKAGKGFTRNLITLESTSVNTINRTYAKRQSTPPMLVRDDGMERLLDPQEHCRVKGAPFWLVENVLFGLATEGLGQGIDYNQGRGLAQLIAAEVMQPLIGMSILDEPTAHNVIATYSVTKPLSVSVTDEVIPADVKKVLSATPLWTPTSDHILELLF